MTSEPSAPSPSSPESSCSCGSGKPYADCCGAGSSAEAAPSDSRALSKLFLAIVTLGLLGAVAWFLNPSQPALRPAALRPQAELPSSLPESPKEVLPTSFTELPDVDLGSLTVPQKREVLLRLNTEPCPCECGNTLASCRVTDSTCETSRELVPKVMEEVKTTSTP